MCECDEQILLVLFFASLYSQNVENTAKRSMNLSEILSPLSEWIGFDDICKIHFGENV